MQEGTTSVPARTIGIDLSDETSTSCTIDACGEVIDETSFATTPVGLDRAFAEIPPSRVVLEASTQVHWVARRLGELGHEVIVANPRKVRLISESTRKTDRNDAHTLARLGRVDPNLLSPIQLRDERALAVRALLASRKHFVQTRTGLISQVRAECKLHGVRLGTASSESFAKRARQQMPEILHQALLPVIDLLEELTRQIRHYDCEIEQLCKNEYPQTEVLRQVRGVGPQVALAYVTAIGDPRRFMESRDVGAYLGLVPRSFQSG